VGLDTGVAQAVFHGVPLGGPFSDGFTIDKALGRVMQADLAS
jgi:hypothetical protein